jgi:opacity protein-like surface antigen
MQVSIIAKRCGYVALAIGSQLCMGSAPVMAVDDGFRLFDFEPNSPYMSVYGGGSFLNDDDVMKPDYNDPSNNYHSISNAGFVFGGSLGIRLNDYIRTEGEMSFSRWTHDYVESFACPDADVKCGPGTSSGVVKLGTGGSTNAFNVFGNAWLDIGLPWNFSAYGGGGVGFTLLAYEDQFFNVDEQDFSFAWQVGGGLRYRWSESLLVDARYVWRGPIRPDYGPSVHEPFEMLSDSFTLGLTYEF